MNRTFAVILALLLFCSCKHGGYGGGGGTGSEWSGGGTLVSFVMYFIL